ncbi:alpha/beta hydrolase [Pseudoxanthomonas putridarboris]|uniref:Alpha/beta hydrolase n=1 Tax=Pseudoxanthomonas putridarboris TaxID=752605 RepID=A0ABU9IXF4_9GAMM
MLRFPLLAMLMAAAALPAAAQARARPVDPDAPTVVLVHGAFADASSWDKVAARLRMRGVPVVAVDNPLTSLEDDVAATRRAIAAAPGKVVLVGHSWGGTVITQAGRDPKVKALVYVAAFAPDAGENSAQQGERFPVAPGLQKLVERAGFLSLSEQTMASDFAQDLKPAQVRAAYAHQLPLKADALSERVAVAAWRSLPSWYVVSRKDRMLSPELQVATARRIGAEWRSVDAGHASPLSAPHEVSDTILEAAGLKLSEPAPGSNGG